MEHSDDDTDSTTSSIDVFEDMEEDDYDSIEDIFLKQGIRQQPSSSTWTYESFSEIGSEYSGSMKNSIIDER